MKSNLQRHIMTAVVIVASATRTVRSWTVSDGSRYCQDRAVHFLDFGRTYPFGSWLVWQPARKREAL